MAAQGLRVVKGDGGKDDDPFALDGSREYSVDKFYTSSGGKNDGESKNVRMPYSIIGKLAELVASRVIPEYKTEADFWRDAAYHRLHAIAQMQADGTLQRRINLEMESMRIKAHAAEMAANKQIVNDYMDVMAGAVAANDKPKLLDVIHDAEALLEHLPSAYRSQLLASVKQYRAEWKKMAD